MSPTDPELKARLVAKAEAVIEELLTKRTAGQEASLQEVEQAVLAVCRREQVVNFQPFVGRGCGKRCRRPRCGTTKW
jgi:hypothetical protein